MQADIQVRSGEHGRGGFQVVEIYLKKPNFANVPLILASSVLLSQIVSNVPYVTLYLPLLSDPTVKGMMALAAGNTMGGNLFILGASSSVIII
jgi:Na+/H+ antiporter NhaD/arsenite permease-like protein